VLICLQGSDVSSNGTDSIKDFDDSRSCDESWSSYYSSGKFISPTVLAETTVFETLEKLGDGYLYTTCDGIPRFRFLSSPTSTLKRVVTVTNSEDFYVYDMEVPRCTANEQYCSRKLNDYEETRLISAYDEVGYRLPLSGACHRYVPPKDCWLDAREEILIFYWPPFQKSRDVCALNGYGSAITVSAPVNFASVITTSAITFQGQDLYIRTYLISDYFTETRRSLSQYIEPSVLTGPFVFTYPTIYLAHHPITVRQFFTKSGNSTAEEETESVIRPAGIIALNSTDIFSMAPVASGVTVNDGLKYAQLIAKGQFNSQIFMGWSNIRLFTERPFDYGQMENPVPASVYFDARSKDCWGKQSHCGTITDDSYRPDIHLKNHVWLSAVSSENFGCRRAVLIDPAVALTELPISTIEPARISSQTQAQPGASFVQHRVAPTKTSDAILPDSLESLNQIEDKQPGPTSPSQSIVVETTSDLSQETKPLAQKPSPEQQPPGQFSGVPSPGHVFLGKSSPDHLFSEPSSPVPLHTAQSSPTLDQSTAYSRSRVPHQKAVSAAANLFEFWMYDYAALGSVIFMRIIIAFLFY
jgi:hypothetical protein